MTSCTVVLEFNYGTSGERESLGSVWLRAGDGRADLDSDSPLEELPGWSRIVGPIEYEAAAQAHAALLRFFGSAGLEVFDEGVAD